jgi:hypothetical protein
MAKKMIHIKLAGLAVLLLFAGIALVSGAPPAPESPSALPLPSTLSLADFERELFGFLDARRYTGLGWHQDKRVRDTGPYIDGVYYGTHPAVRIFYSPEVYGWLKAGRPQDTILPDGAMIVKEMYTPPAARYGGLAEEDIEAALAGWAVMVRDSAGSRDGWFWAYYAPGQAVDNNDYPFSYPNAGFGQYCVRCHASAQSQFTFASLRNVKGEPGDPVLYRVDNSWLETDPLDKTLLQPHVALATGADAPAVAESKPIRDANADFLQVFNMIPPLSPEEVAPLPPVTLGHVVAAAEPPQGPEHYLTSDQCMSCHDGQGLPFGPNMFIPADDNHDGINLSPFGEWSWSMMGLAGRDPIFYAQLESELSLFGDKAGFIQDLCLSCHGVMGQRQWHSDGHSEDFTLDKLNIADVSDPNHKYGALARDGISCTVCHQIVDDGEPLREIVTGRFRVSAPEGGLSTIYGPFKDPTTRPMEITLGMTPKQSDYISSSRLCASCHTIFLPVYNEDGLQLDEDFEQSTYLEWLNSAFENELGTGSTPKTCQDCHMTTEYHGQSLAFRIANIQDQTYPESDHLAALEDITVPIRGGKGDTLPPGINDYGEEAFRRHTLLGINQFALEMFNQFDDVLGVRKINYMTGSANGLATAIAQSDRLAKEETADVEILQAQLDGATLSAQVKVSNRIGHRFPSGVGFRGAFLEFKVIDGHDTVVWASGRTNALGIIVDEAGKPLPSEFFEIDPATHEQAFQPHYQTITRQDQVQIYEELVKSPEGVFTTSFLNRMHPIKDNRLLPRGWSQEGPEGFKAAYSSDAEEAAKALEATMPKGNVLEDADFLDGSGSDLITYRVELPSHVLEQLAAGLTVRASLYYQAIPPYYLHDRFTTAQGMNTQRLYYLASHLNVEGTNIETWKLLIGSVSASIGKTGDPAIHNYLLGSEP